MNLDSLDRLTSAAIATFFVRGGGKKGQKRVSVPLEKKAFCLCLKFSMCCSVFANLRCLPWVWVQRWAHV